MCKVICKKADRCDLPIKCAHGVPHVAGDNCPTICGECAPVKEEPKPRTMRCPAAGTKEYCEMCAHCENHSEIGLCNFSSEYCSACEPVPEEPELKFGDTVYGLGGHAGRFGRYIAQASRKGHIYVLFLDRRIPTIVSRHKVTTTPPKKKELWEDLEVGQPVVVWDTNPSPGIIKFFLKYCPGETEPIRCNGGLDGSTVLEWPNFRLPTKDEMIKLGFDLNRWKFTEDGA